MAYNFDVSFGNFGCVNFFYAISWIMRVLSQKPPEGYEALLEPDFPEGITKIQICYWGDYKAGVTIESYF